ncbi:sensor histidine kinase [Nonomuraea soli]|uniref:histidine kinase n=1 Tax=Nonomuraea soli TaxID=1032476 RepID=A0A7W0HNT4_9ACTN|nr:HAMP domain-containing sensor histidine kinase [Nonomuraea soli]MBA2889886.1 two-component system OmpR family sensor kinase [Nonomuraea soli]
MVAVAIVLLTALTLVIATATTLQLHASQRAQLDDRVRDAARRAVMAASRIPGDAPADYLFVPGQSIGTFGARLRDGAVAEATVLSSETAIDTVDAPPALLGVGRRPVTVSLGDELGDYRMVAERGRTGDVIVTGLPEAPMNATISRFIAMEAVVALTAVVLAALLGTAMVRRAMRPLHRLAATATRVSEQPLDRGDVVRLARVPDAYSHPGTEVGQVGVALNQMLGHIEESLAARHAGEVRLRKFVADASHELRTPLASIAGYAELAARDPGTHEHSLRRIRSETTRMTALVEDLLLLAKLDAGRPLAREELDLRPLLVNAVSDAYAASREHRWLVDFPGAGPEPGPGDDEPDATEPDATEPGALADDELCVVGDADRLYQVVTNLLANARSHTPPGTTVTTTLTVESGWLALRVRDDGPGIAAEVLPDLFDRFTRGDAGRSRQVGGTGLGLAIVAAVTAAHGGRVEVSSVPGDTVFTVWLPGARS